MKKVFSVLGVILVVGCAATVDPLFDVPVWDCWAVLYAVLTALKIFENEKLNYDKILYETDLIILKMALAEMINFSSIPVKVSINEYIELAKNFLSDIIYIKEKFKLLDNINLLVKPKRDLNIKFHNKNY